MTDSINTHQYWQIEILTPVHVGVGLERAWQPGTDFIVRGNEVCLLDTKATYDKLEEKKRLDHYVSCLIGDDRDGYKKELERLGEELPVWQKYQYSYPAGDILQIRPLIRNGADGQPYLPGSSLKGAIRSILFRYLRKEVPALATKTNDKDVFGSIDNNLMRFFRFTDAPLAPAKLMRAKIYNLRKEGDDWEGGWKRGSTNTTQEFDKSGFHTDYEVFAVGAVGYLRYGTMCQMPPDFWSKITKDYPSHHTEVLKNAGFDLFAVINAHTKQYLKKQIAFFTAYKQAKHAEKIIEQLEQLLALIPADNSFCILKLAAGSGFHSITGDWQYEKFIHIIGPHKGKLKYKSRKIAFEGEQFYPMGFVKLSRTTPEAIQTAKQALVQAEQEKAQRLNAEAQAKAEADAQAEQKKAQTKAATPQSGKEVVCQFAKKAGTALMVKAEHVDAQMELLLPKELKKDANAQEKVESGSPIRGRYKAEGKIFKVEFISFV
jgi:hypothetical protein